MANYVIDLDPFNPFSVMSARNRFQRALSDFDTKVDEFIQRLAEIGQRAAQGAYGSAISVTIQPIDDGVALIASGEAVVFLEFGAGSRVDTGNILAKEMPFEVDSGSWSRSPEGSGEFAMIGKWEFPPGSGNYMEYVQPRNGMEKAYEAMVRDIETLARAVFG